MPRAKLRPNPSMWGLGGPTQILEDNAFIIALEAYHDSLHGEAAPVIDALTGDQRFFRSWAQYYRGKGTEAFIRQYMVNNEHSYWPFRINGGVRNIDEWYEAFEVNPTDRLYIAPEKRVRIW